MLTRKTLWLVLMTALAIMLLGTAPMALAAEGDRPVVQPDISLDEAIQLALTNSEDYRIAKYAIVEQQKLADYANDTNTRYSEESTEGQGTAQVQSSWYNYLAADLRYDMSKLTADKTADLITNTVQARYGDVLVAQAALVKAESDRILAEQEYRIARIKHQVGMLSDLDFQAAEQTAESNDTAVNTAQSDLNASYTLLNTLIGLGAGSRPVLTDETVYEKIKVDDLESEVDRVLINAPTVYEAEQNALLKEYEINVLGYTGAYRPYEARQSELKQTKLAVTSARESMATSTRSIYYSILAVEDSYQEIEDKAEAARISALKQRALFDVGMCTSYELEQVENTVKSFDAQLIQLKWNHHKLLNSFATPWAMAS